MQDLFFEFPWNNFLGNAVSDFIHRILTRNDGGLRRKIVVALFRDARLGGAAHERFACCVDRIYVE
jgi:hypothetical protein